jgi:hypothetical protein
MTAMKIYLDEDVHTFIAHTLRLRGWEALTTQKAGQREVDDIGQIAFATERGYAMLSYNVQDFPRLHYELIGSGQPHSGIIVPHKTTRAGISVRPCRSFIVLPHLTLCCNAGTKATRIGTPHSR